MVGEWIFEFKNRKIEGIVRIDLVFRYDDNSLYDMD